MVDTVAQTFNEIFTDYDQFKLKVIDVIGSDYNNPVWLQDGSLVVSLKVIYKGFKTKYGESFTINEESIFLEKLQIAMGDMLPHLFKITQSIRNDNLQKYLTDDVIQVLSETFNEDPDSYVEQTTATSVSPDSTQGVDWAQHSRVKERQAIRTRDNTKRVSLTKDLVSRLEGIKNLDPVMFVREFVNAGEIAELFNVTTDRVGVLIEYRQVVEKLLANVSSVVEGLEVLTNEVEALKVIVLENQDRLNKLNTAGLTHTRRDGQQTFSNIEHWYARDGVDDNKQEIDNIKEIVLGLDADANVVSTSDQTLPVNDMTRILFDEVIKGDSTPSTGNVDLVNNTITVNDYTDVKGLRFSHNTIFTGDDQGIKSGVKLQVEHLDAAGIYKEAYIFERDIKWDVNNLSVIDTLNVSVVDNSIAYKKKEVVEGVFKLVEVKVPISPGDRFILVASIPDTIQQAVIINLKHFTVTDVSNLTAPTTASQIIFDPSTTSLTTNNVQLAIEEVHKNDLVVDLTTLTTSDVNPTGQAIYNGFLSRIDVVSENPESFTIILDLPDGDDGLNGKAYVKVRHFTTTSMQLEGFIYSPSANTNAPIHVVRQSIFSGDVTPIRPTHADIAVTTTEANGPLVATNKAYVDAADSTTLASANAYTDATGVNESTVRTIIESYGYERAWVPSLEGLDSPVVTVSLTASTSSRTSTWVESGSPVVGWQVVKYVNDSNANTDIISTIRGVDTIFERGSINSIIGRLSRGMVFTNSQGIERYTGEYIIRKVNNIWTLGLDVQTETDASTSYKLAFFPIRKIYI